MRRPTVPPVPTLSRPTGRTACGEAHKQEFILITPTPSHSSQARYETARKPGRNEPVGPRHGPGVGHCVEVILFTLRAPSPSISGSPVSSPAISELSVSRSSVSPALALVLALLWRLELPPFMVLPQPQAKPVRPWRERAGRTMGVAGMGALAQSGPANGGPPVRVAPRRGPRGRAPSRAVGGPAVSRLVPVLALPSLRPDGKAPPVPGPAVIRKVAPPGRAKGGP